MDKLKSYFRHDTLGLLINTRNRFLHMMLIKFCTMLFATLVNANMSGARKMKLSKIKTWRVSNKKNIPEWNDMWGESKRERKKYVLTMARYSWERHHGWCTQATWTKIVNMQQQPNSTPYNTFKWLWHSSRQPIMIIIIMESGQNVTAGVTFLYR